MKKNSAPRVILAVWMAIWVLFLIRPVIKKDLLREYAALSTLSTEDKRARVTGEELYLFIKFCNESLPERSTYNIAGLDKYSLEHRRLRYYLYPHIEKDRPDFMLVYKVKDFSNKDYRIFKAIDSEKYILKKIL